MSYCNFLWSRFKNFYIHSENNTDMKNLKVLMDVKLWHENTAVISKLDQSNCRRRGN
jgi:hypothetical protein